VAQTAAATFTTSATTKVKRIVFEIVPEQCMDVANGFDCIAVSTGASNAANITEAHLVSSRPTSRHRRRTRWSTDPARRGFGPAASASPVSSFPDGPLKRGSERSSSP
jgi:hypothetical protein